MEGNHLMTPQSRLLLAASIFALLALGALVVVWMWPIWFADPVAEAPGELTEEQQEKIREDLRAALRMQAETGSSVPEEEQESIRAELVEQASAPETELPPEESEDVRAQLRAQMQQ